ncbi:MAG: DUF1801 domain-containing protein [Granulosicoccus sp.]
MRRKFETYPETVQERMHQLRGLIFTIARDNKFGEVDETLKWGELSYHVEGGSPIRIDWKSKDPGHYCMYFICSTKLLDTFKELHGNTLNLQGNRSIVFSLHEELPEQALEQCISLAFQYQKLKDLPLLGA